LIDMLEGPSRVHQLSALWVVERLRLLTMRDRIDEISRENPDESVRRRAESVLRDWESLGERQKSVAGPPVELKAGETP
jgi:hypothetical protein